MSTLGLGPAALVHLQRHLAREKLIHGSKHRRVLRLAEQLEQQIPPRRAHARELISDLGHRHADPRGHELHDLLGP